jgi:hypothetical protein
MNWKENLCRSPGRRLRQVIDVRAIDAHRSVSSLDQSERVGKRRG